MCLLTVLLFDFDFFQLPIEFIDKLSLKILKIIISRKSAEDLLAKYIYLDPFDNIKGIICFHKQFLWIPNFLSAELNYNAQDYTGITLEYY